MNLYEACPVPGTSYCQPELSDLTDDAFVTQFNIEWLVTQIEERKALQEVITLYPNPVNDVLTIQVSDNYVGSQVSVMSIDGRTVWNAQQIRSSGLLNIPTSGLAQGVYVLRIDRDGQMHTAKFVKQ